MFLEGYRCLGTQWRQDSEKELKRWHTLAVLRVVLLVEMYSWKYVCVFPWWVTSACICRVVDHVFLQVNSSSFIMHGQSVIQFYWPSPIWHASSWEKSQRRKSRRKTLGGKLYLCTFYLSLSLRFQLRINFRCVCVCEFWGLSLQNIQIVGLHGIGCTRVRECCL